MQGRVVPVALPGGRGVLVPGDVTLVSPPVLVPAGTQAVRLALRAPGGDGLLLVAARPEGGGPDVPLGALEPGRVRAPLALPVPAALGGTAVRLVLDPVPALGTTLEVHRAGPLVAPLPGWAVARGLPDVAGARGRRTLRVRDAPLSVTAPALLPPRGARHLLVDVRGDGVLRARAGAATTAARATARWRTIRVALPRRRAAVRLALTATPGPGGLELRRIGVVARTTGRSGGSAPR